MVVPGEEGRRDHGGIGMAAPDEYYVCMYVCMHQEVKAVLKGAAIDGNPLWA